jgi:hypothetical protein
MEHAVLQLIVVGQEQQAFAVGIEPSDGIHVMREWPEVAERPLPGRAGELGEDTVGLVEQHVVQIGRLQSLELLRKKNPSLVSRDAIISSEVQ